MTARQKQAPAFPLAVLKWIWARQGQEISLREYEFLSRAVQSCLGRALEQPQEAPGCCIALLDISVLETEPSALYMLLEDDYCCQRWGSQCPFPLLRGAQRPSGECVYPMFRQQCLSVYLPLSIQECFCCCCWLFFFFKHFLCLGYLIGGKWTFGILINASKPVSWSCTNW